MDLRFKDLTYESLLVPSVPAGVAAAAAVAAGLHHHPQHLHPFHSQLPPSVHHLAHSLHPFSQSGHHLHESTSSLSSSNTGLNSNSRSNHSNNSNNNTNNNSTNNNINPVTGKVKRARQRVDAGEPRNSYASITNFSSTRSSAFHHPGKLSTSGLHNSRSSGIFKSSSSSSLSSSTPSASSSSLSKSSSGLSYALASPSNCSFCSNNQSHSHSHHHSHHQHSSSSSSSSPSHHHSHHHHHRSSSASTSSHHSNHHHHSQSSLSPNSGGSGISCNDKMTSQYKENQINFNKQQNVDNIVASLTASNSILGVRGSGGASESAVPSGINNSIVNLNNMYHNGQSSQSSSSSSQQQQQQQQFITNYYQQLISFSKNTPPSVPSSSSSPIPLLANVDLASSLPLPLQPPTRSSASQRHISPGLHPTVSSSTTTPTLNPPSYSSFIQASTSPSQSIPSEYDGSSNRTGGAVNTVGDVSGLGKRELDQEEEIGSEGNSSSSPSAHLLRVILQKGRGQRRASSNRNENNDNNQVNCDKIGSNSSEGTRKGQNDDDETDEEKDEDDCETDSGRTITGSPTGNNGEEGGDKVDDEEDDDDEDDNSNNNNQHNNNNNEYNNNEDDDQVFSSTVGGLPEDDDDDATDDGRNDDDYPEASCSVESEGEPDGDDYTSDRPGGTNINASKIIAGVGCTQQSDRYNLTCDEYNNNANNNNNNEIMNLNGGRGVDNDSGTELKSTVTPTKTIKSTDPQSDRDQSDSNLLSNSNEISADNHNNNGSSCSDDIKSSSDLPLQLTSEIGDNHQQLTSSSSSSPCSTSVTTTTSTLSANGLTTISDVKRARVENIVTNMLPRSSSNSGHLSKLSNLEENNNRPIETSPSVIKERKQQHSTKTLSASESCSLSEVPTTTMIPTVSNLTSGSSSVIVNGCKKRKLYHPQQSKSNGSLDDEESDDLDEIVGEDDDDEMIGGESQVNGDASGLDEGAVEEDDEMNDSLIALSSERLDDYEMSEIKDLSIKSSVKCESGDKSDYDESSISIKENSDRHESRLSTLMENYEPNSSLTEPTSNNIPKDLSKSSSSSLGNSGRSHKRKDHNHHHRHRLSDDPDEDVMADDELGALGDDDSRLNHAIPSSQVNLSKSPHHLSSSSSSHHHHRRFGVGLQDPISLLNEARKLVYEQEKMTKGNSSNPSSSSSSNHESHHNINPHYHHHRHSSRSSRKRSLVPPLISTASSSISNMVNGGPLGTSDLPLPPPIATSPPMFYSDIEWLRDTLKADLQVNSIPSFSTIIDSVINRFCQRRAASAAAAAALASRSSIGPNLHPQYSILPQKDSSDLMIGRNPDSLAAVAVAAAMASASRSSLPNTNHHHHHHPFPLLPPSHKEPEDLIMSRNSDSSAAAVTPTPSNRLSISNPIHNPFQISPPKEPEDLILQRNSDSFAAVAAAALASRSSILPTIHPQYQILPHKEPEDLMLQRNSDSYVAAAAAAAAAVAASRSAAASDSTVPEASKELTLLSQMLESKSSRTIHGKPFESSNQQQQSQQSNHHHSKTNVPRESPSQQQQQQQSSSSSQHTSSSSHHHRQLSTPLNTSASNGSNNDSPLNGHHQLLHPHLAHHHSQGSSSSISPAPSTGAPPGENSPNWWAAINIENNSTLTPMHLRKAKLMFFYVRYPSSNVLKTFFPDIKFGKNNTAQLVKWFSNFREFYYIQMEKYARQAMTEGIKSADEIHVHRESELLRVLNMHYNRSNHLDVPERFCFVVEQTLKEFFKSIAAGKDNEQSWKKAIYKIISRLDDPVPEYFKSPNFLERLE